MKKIIEELWNSYRELTPSVSRVQEILDLNNQGFFSDHIAFRTISHPKFNKEQLAYRFIKKGYYIKGYYRFYTKKLRAIHLEHSDPNLPRIFISEIVLEDVSFYTRDLLIKAFNHIPRSFDNILKHGRNWKVSHFVYNQLQEESEYAAWLYVHGLRPNHFTLNVNKLKFHSIDSVCALISDSGIKMNTSGGLIKGSAYFGLKQASTIADQIPIVFEDVNEPILTPSCYIEFAERFKKNNALFSGFITSSADRIFESTNKKLA